MPDSLASVIVASLFVCLIVWLNAGRRREKPPKDEDWRSHLSYRELPRPRMRGETGD